MICYSCGSTLSDAKLKLCQICNERFCSSCWADHVHSTPKLSSDTVTDYTLQELRRMELVQRIGQLHDKLAATVDVSEQLSEYPNLESGRRETQDRIVTSLVEAIRELRRLRIYPLCDDFEHDNEMIKRIVRDHLEPDKILCHLGWYKRGLQMHREAELNCRSASETSVLNDREAGFEAALRLYAYWKDGVQCVGSCGKTLEQALEDMRKGSR